MKKFYKFLLEKVKVIMVLLFIFLLRKVKLKFSKKIKAKKLTIFSVTTESIVTMMV